MNKKFDRESTKFAVQRLVNELDYDLWKSIDSPEDPDELTWDDLIDIFIYAYEEDQDSKQ